MKISSVSSTAQPLVAQKHYYLRNKIKRPRAAFTREAIYIRVL